jgi:hypothetical protein
VDRPGGGHDLRESAVLREIAVGTGLDDLGQRLAVLHTGQDHHPALRLEIPDALNGVGAVRPQEPGVHKDDIRRGALDFREGLSFVPGVGDHPEVGLPVKYVPQRLPEQ